MNTTLRIVAAYARAVLALTLLSACGSSGKNASAPSLAGASACPKTPLAAQAARGTLLVQNGHAQPINVLTLSGDGRVLGSAALDGTLRIWDTKSGLLLRIVRSEGAAYAVSLSRDGQVAAYAEGPANAPTSIVVHPLGGEARPAITPFGEIALSPDGAMLAIGRARSLDLVDASTRAMRWSVPLAKAPEGELPFVAFSEDGRRIAVVDAGAVRVVRASDGTTERSFPRAPKGAYQFHDMVSELFVGAHAAVRKLGSGDVDVLPLEGDATPKRVAVKIAQLGGSGVRLWGISSDRHEVVEVDLATAQILRRKPLERDPFRMALSGDGSTLVLAYGDAIEGNSLEVMDLATLQVISTIEGRPSGVNVLALAPGDRELAVASLASLAQWSLPDGELRRSTPDRRIAGASSLAYDSAGARLASVEATGLRVRDSASGRVVAAWDLPLGARGALATYLPSGELLTVDNPPSGSAEIAAWRVPSTPRADAGSRRDPPPPMRAIGAAPWAAGNAVVSRDGSLLFLGSDISRGIEGEIALVDLATGGLRWRTKSATSSFRWATFSADNTSILVSAYASMSLTERVMPAALLRRYEAATGKLVAEVQPISAGPIAVLGGSILVGGDHPFIADAKSLATTHTLDVSDSRITAVLAANDAKGWFIGGDGGAVTLVASGGETRATLVATNRGDYVATTPGGAFHASVDGARSVVWTYANPLEAFSFEQFAARFERPDLVRAALSGAAASAPAALSRPPSIQLKSGPGALRTDARSVKLEAHVRSPSQIDRVRVFVDGRPAGERLVCAREGDVALDVPVPSGESRVAMIAYDAEGLSSNPATVDVSSTRKDKRPSIWIVAVGVSRYPGLSPELQLEVADDDARSLGKAFASEAGPDKLFDSAHVETILDEDATPARLLSALSALEAAAPDDLAVVFLAGHGVELPEGGMVFLTSRATLKADDARREGVGWDKLGAALGRVPARVVVFLDACHSGHLSTASVAPNDALAAGLAASGRAGVFVFAAARGSQLSYEVSADGSGSRGLDLAMGDDPAPRVKAFGETGHGLFTSALLEALAGEAPDRDKSGAIEISELVGYVTERVRAASNGTQTPWVARREMFGDFAIARATAH